MFRGDLQDSLFLKCQRASTTSIMCTAYIILFMNDKHFTKYEACVRSLGGRPVLFGRRENKYVPRDEEEENYPVGLQGRDVIHFNWKVSHLPDRKFLASNSVFHDEKLAEGALTSSIDDLPVKY